MSARLSGKRVLLAGGVANIGLAILEVVAEGATDKNDLLVEFFARA